MSGRRYRTVGSKVRKHFTQSKIFTGPCVVILRREPMIKIHCKRKYQCSVLAIFFYLQPTKWVSTSFICMTVNANLYIDS